MFELMSSAKRVDGRLFGDQNQPRLTPARTENIGAAMNRRSLLLTTPALLGNRAWGVEATQPPSARGAVTFGISASLTGGQAGYGKDVRDGVLAAFSAANKASLDKGPRFELTVLDDGGDREKCKANVKSLIDGGAVALVGLTSGAAAEACLPLIEESQIPLLGTATGNMGIRNEKLTMPYHIRAGYDVEYKHMMRYVKDFGFQRVGYVHLKDTSPANQAAMTAALDAVGVKLALSVPVDRNAKNYDAESDALIAANLSCVMFTTNAAPVEKLIARLSAARYGGTYFSSSFAGQSLISSLAGKGVSVIMTQVVPRPTAVALPLVKRYQEDLAALSSEANVGYTSLEGYIAGRVAIEAAKNTPGGASMSRARFRSALAELRVDLGGYRVQFGGTTKNGSNLIDIIAVDRSGRIIG
jgi:branched-chain amino acid transport system substrate-binding protein